MPKHKPNEEIFIDGDRAIRFVANFGMLEALNNFGTDPSMVFSDLSIGNLNPVYIKNVMSSSVLDIDNDILSESVKDDLVIELINKYGLQECSIVARMLLTHGLIGDIKKSESALAEQRGLLHEMLIPSTSQNSMKVFYLWAAMSLTSTALACLITRLYTLYI